MYRCTQSSHVQSCTLESRHVHTNVCGAQAHICVRVHKHAHMHTCTHTDKYTHLHVHMQIYTHPYTFNYLYTHLLTHRYTHIFSHACMHKPHTYTHTHTHTHTHTYQLSFRLIGKDTHPAHPCGSLAGRGRDAQEPEQSISSPTLACQLPGELCPARRWEGPRGHRRAAGQRSGHQNPGAHAGVSQHTLPPA